MTVRFVNVSLMAVAGIASSLSAQTVSGDTILKEGDMQHGLLVENLNAPFTNGNGEVGFVARLEDNSYSVWFDNGSTFHTGSTGGMPVLSVLESSMGISDNGNFIVSPNIDSADGIWTDSGLILVENTDAPALPGFITTFHTRPRMDDLGNSYWIAGLNDGAGGTDSETRVLYKRDNSGLISIVFNSGDVIPGSGGLTIALSNSGVDGDYYISGDGSQWGNTFNLETGSSSDDSIIAINGTMIAREGEAIGDGENWDNFDRVAINNSGNYLFSGDTDGSSSTDDFIAYNGTIQIRENDMILDGILDGGVDALTINENNEAAFIWDLSDGIDDPETLFFASDASDLLNSTIAILSVNDGFDDDGDGIADWIITDFNAGTGQGLDLAEDGFIYAEVDIETLDGTSNLEAVIRLSVSSDSGCSIADLNADGVLDFFDISEFLNLFSASDSTADFNNDGMLDFFDISAFLNVFSAGCP